jgi:hypothetical protein
MLRNNQQQVADYCSEGESHSLETSLGQRMCKTSCDVSCF